MVNLQTLTMKYECLTCLFTYITTVILYSWDKSIDFSLWHSSATHDFQHITAKRFKVYQVIWGYHFRKNNNWNQRKYIILHMGEHQIHFHLVAI